MASIMLATACATSPLGRSQLILLPEEQLDQMGALAYEQVKENTPTSDDPAAHQRVQCIIDAITQANSLGGEDWQVTVFADEAINAFALPGGRIGVYQGLLTIAEDQHELSVVLGHEIAHVLARHGNERVSTAFAADSALQIAAIASGEPSARRDRLFSLLGLGAQVGVLLPFSRTQETEADILGLQLIANAGFDPNASVTLWQKMARESKNTPPEFLSTHPDSERRIAELRQQLANAIEVADRAHTAGRQPNCD